jgi:hypothetical protein
MNARRGKKTGEKKLAPLKKPKAEGSTADLQKKPKKEVVTEKLTAKISGWRAQLQKLKSAYAQKKRVVTGWIGNKKKEFDSQWQQMQEQLGKIPLPKLPDNRFTQEIRKSIPPNLLPNFIEVKSLSKRFIQTVFGVTMGALVLLFVWKFHEPLLLRNLNLYDEGVTLLGAKRLAGSEVPYRDFFTIYGPLKFSLLGSVFANFGSTLLVSRIFFAAVSMIGFALVFLFFRRESNTAYATIFTIFLAFFGKMSMTPVFLVLTAGWFAAFLRKPDGHLLPLVGGVLLGLLFLLRIDFGGFSLLSIFFLLILFYLFSPRFTGHMFAAAIGKMAAIFSITVLPFFIALYQWDALYEFWRQALLFPLFGDYQALRSLPWNTIDQLKIAFDGLNVNLRELSFNFAWFFWPIPFVAFAIFWTKQIIKKQVHLEGFLLNALLGFFTIAGFIYANHRSDFGHVEFLNLLGAIFLLHLILQFRHREWGFLYVPIFAVVILASADNLLQTRSTVIASPKTEYSFYPEPFVQSEANDNLEKTLQWFANIPADEEVYVGVSDTSRVFVNNVMLPFLLEQPVATKYHELHTGIVTTTPVQTEMIDELQDTNYVVLWDLFYCEPNKGCESTGVYLVDEYIKQNFTLVEQFGKYLIYERNR